jgi:VanZ family protein
VVFGALDEEHQHFVPTRAMRFEDLVLDTLGVLLGTLLFLLWREVAPDR